METQTAYRYIVKKHDTNEPTIQGTRITVRDVVEQWKIGASPEEIPIHYPHITLSQVFEALAYYHDNKIEIEKFIEVNKALSR
ncbi:MAG: DUF433 domain-containing protein [Bacteroidota bacterium]|nr:DUF433 domain-containing protein [Bacteroidota bacterium]